MDGFRSKVARAKAAPLTSGFRLWIINPNPLIHKSNHVKNGSRNLVITDMTMPHMSGITLTRKMQEISPHKPVIICTGYSETIHGKTADELNVSALMMKPVQIKILAVEINKALKKSIRDRNQVLQNRLSAV